MQPVSVELARELTAAMLEAFSSNDRPKLDPTENDFEFVRRYNLKIDGRAFDFDGYKHLVEVFEDEHPEQVLMAGAQTGKSARLLAFQLQVPIPVGEVNPHAPGWEPEPYPVAVWVVPDLVYRPAGADRRHVIVDWKTGRVDDAARAQVGVYAAWLSQRDGIAPEDIAAVAVYLQHYVEKPVQGSAELVAESLDHIRASARKALAYVEDGDPRVNRPKPMEAFEQLPADSKECRYCAFRRLCGRG